MTAAILDVYRAGLTRAAEIFTRETYGLVVKPDLAAALDRTKVAILAEAQA